MRVTLPKISGVVRWLKADRRSSAFWPIWTWSMSCGLTLRLDRKLVGIGHDQHDRVAGGDDAADGMHVGLEHHAVLRRADVDALELILGGDLAFDEFADLAVDFARLLGHFAAQIAVDLDDLQFGFGDLAGGLGGLRDQLPRFALQPRRRALELGQLGERDKLLLPQIVDAVLFAVDQLGFLFLGIALRLEAADLFLELLDPLAKLRLLADARVAAQLEQLALAIEDEATSGSLARASSSGGNFTLSAPSRSLSSRALRAVSSSRPLVTMARLARVTVSSRRTRIRPA